MRKVYKRETRSTEFPLLELKYIVNTKAPVRRRASQVQPFLFIHNKNDNFKEQRS